VPQVPSFRQTPDIRVPPTFGQRAVSIVQPGAGMFDPCAGKEQHPDSEGGVVVVVVVPEATVVVVADVRVTIELTQESTADSIAGPSPLTAHPPSVSALAIAALNLVSAVLRHFGSTAAPSCTAFCWHLSFASIFFAAALLFATEHLCAGACPA
jgi:hypothetical protein